MTMLLKIKHHRTLVFITMLTFVAQFMSVSVHASSMLDVNQLSPNQAFSYQQLPTNNFSAENHCQNMANMGVEHESSTDYSYKTCCGEDCSMMNCVMASAIVTVHNFSMSLSLSNTHSDILPIKLANPITYLYRPPIAA